MIPALLIIAPAASPARQISAVRVAEGPVTGGDAHVSTEGALKNSVNVELDLSHTGLRFNPCAGPTDRAAATWFLAV